MSIRRVSTNGRGRKPEYNSYHLWKAYQVLRERGPIGRKVLAERLSVGVGSARTIVDRLVGEGKAVTTRRGTELTPDGKAYFDRVGIVTAPLDEEERTCVALIRGRANSLEDSAPMQVEGGAIERMWFRDGVLHGSRGEVPSDLGALITNVLEPVEGDGIIVATSDSWRFSEELAVTEALSVADPSVPCWEGSGGQEDQESMDLRCVTLIVHELMGRLPVTMRYKNRPGVRCERGEIIDENYTGPVLEEALEKNSIVRKVAHSGAYKGVPIVVVPVKRRGEAIAAIGVVDITKGAIFDIMRRMKPG